VNDKLVRMRVRENFSEVLCSPFRSGMSRDTTVQNLSADQWVR
jgi:hypothetical protein